MRIVAGRARGTKLAPVPAGTRPLSDRAREGLFSSLGKDVAAARCVDLFAGTGAVGIEALSRGALSCDFVDSSAQAVRTIETNLTMTKMAGAANVIRAGAGRFLARPGDPYALAFVDPPYEFAEDSLRDVLSALTARLVPNGVFVLTRSAKNPVDVIPVNFAVARTLAYGDALVLICRETT